MMKKHKKYSICLVAILAILICITENTCALNIEYITDSANLKKFKYAKIDNNVEKTKKNEIIYIKDSRLADSLSRVQDKGYIYKEYLKTIEKLEISNPKNYYSDSIYVRNLDGIEYLENVKEIRLKNNKIENLDKLKDLKNLEVLDLTNNEIKDISALKSLTNLRKLILRNNYIEDITPLKELTNLEYLDLSENNITDISGVEDLTNIKNLYLNKNKITDIGKLRKLKNLRTIELNNNMIKDIQVVSNLKILNNLMFKNNFINDVDVLNELPYLNIVDLANNPIKEFSTIPEFYDTCNMKELDITKISENKYKFVNKIKDYYTLVEAIKNNGYFEIEDKNIKQVYDKAQEIINKIIKDRMTDIEKEIVLHDYVVNNTIYDYENYKNDTIPIESYSPYGILIKGTGVSSGYTETMNLLLNMVGIDCSIISGTAKGKPHDWNVVKLDGEYYHLDTTWDDPINMDIFTGKKRGILTHDYFNLSDEQMREDHQWNSKIKCIGEKFYYKYYSYCKKKGIKIDDFKKIHGTVIIPEDEISDEYFYTTLKIWAESSETDKFNKKKGFKNYVLVKIPPGKVYGEYSMIVPNDGKRYKVYYDYNNSKANSITKGYYTKNGRVIQKDNNNLLELKKDNEFDFNILMGRTLTVNIKLPNGDTAPKGGLKLLLYGDSHKNDGQYSKTVVVPEGENNFEVDITKIKSKGKLYLRYKIWSENCPYKREGYYTKRGITTDESKKTFIDENTDYVELSFIKEYAISGNIELPNHEKAPEGGLRVQLILSKYNRKRVSDLQVLIPEGENSVPFNIGVERGSYEIEYFVIGQQDYCSHGYYRKNGCSAFYKDRTLINSSIKKDITMTLLKGKILEGIIYLPDGETADNDIKIGLTIFTDSGTDNKYNDDLYWRLSTCIYDGDNSGYFYVYLPECRSGYELKLSVYGDYEDYDEYDKYVDHVYYNKSKMVKYKRSASRIRMDKDKKIEMTLIKNKN